MGLFVFFSSERGHEQVAVSFTTIIIRHIHLLLLPPLSFPPLPAVHIPPPPPPPFTHFLPLLTVGDVVDVVDIDEQEDGGQEEVGGNHVRQGLGGGRQRLVQPREHDYIQSGGWVWVGGWVGWRRVAEDGWFYVPKERLSTVTAKV